MTGTPKLRAVTATLISAIVVCSTPAIAETGPRATDDYVVQKDNHFSLGHIAHPKRLSRAADGATHQIRLRSYDQNGEAVLPAGAYLIDVVTGTGYEWKLDGDTIVTTAPEGRYSLLAVVRTGGAWTPSDYALYNDGELELTKDVDLTLDARQAQLVQTRTPSPTAKMFTSRIAVWQHIAGQTLRSHVNGDAETSLHAWPSPPTDEPFHSLYMETKSEPLATKPSPKAYYLMFSTKGRIPASLTYVARASDLAHVRTTRATQGDLPIEGASQSEFMTYTDLGATYGLTLAVPAPAIQDMYYTAKNVAWKGEFAYYRSGSGEHVAELQDSYRTFRPGRKYRETWDTPGFGPTIRMGHGSTQLLALSRPANTGQPGRSNLGGNTFSGGLTLKRNGVLMTRGAGSGPMGAYWDLPADKASFELTVTNDREQGFSEYSTKTQARWTFTSSGSGSSSSDMHGLLHPRVTGAFDVYGRAPSGRVFPLDIRMERPPAGTAVKALTVQVSYDDGTTWTKVRLVPVAPDRWLGLPYHPRKNNGFVSLRITARDGTGNSVDQTVTRSYGLK